MRKPQSKAASIRKQMEDLQSELKRAEVEEEIAFGKLARKAGLFDVDIPEKEMKEALSKIADRFRSGKAKAEPEAESSTP